LLIEKFIRPFEELVKGLKDSSIGAADYGAKFGKVPDVKNVG